MGLQLVGRGGVGWVEDRGEQPIRRVVRAAVVNRVVDHPHPMRHGVTTRVAARAQFADPGSISSVSTRRGVMFALARHNRSAPVASALSHNGYPENPRSANNTMFGCNRSTRSTAVAGRQAGKRLPRRSPARQRPRGMVVACRLRSSVSRCGDSISQTSKRSTRRSSAGTATSPCPWTPTPSQTSARALSPPPLARFRSGARVRAPSTSKWTKSIRPSSGSSPLAGNVVGLAQPPTD